MKKKILSRLCLILLVLATLFSFAGCSASRTVRASSNAERVVATAGEIDILYDEYYYLAMTRLAQLKLEYGEDAMSNPEARAKLDAFLAQNLLTQSHALLAIGRSLGIDVDSGDIAASVDDHMAAILEDTFAGDRNAYIESLREGYLTDRYIRTFVAIENYLSIEIIKVLLQNGTLDDSDEAALAFLKSDDVIRVHQVVINEILDAKGNAIRTKEQAKEKAQALRDAFLNAESAEERDAAFLAAMGESSDWGDLTGDGLYYARGELAKDYADIVFAIPLYGACEVFEVEDGYAFVMRLPKDEQYMKENLGSLKSKTYYVTLNDMIDRWLAENPLQMTSFGESLDPTALEIIEPDGGVSWGLILPLIIGGVVLVAGIFVIRVFVLRSRVKKGMPIHGGKKKKSVKK